MDDHVLGLEVLLVPLSDILEGLLVVLLKSVVPARVSVRFVLPVFILVLDLWGDDVVRGEESPGGVVGHVELQESVVTSHEEVSSVTADDIPDSLADREILEPSASHDHAGEVVSLAVHVERRIYDFQVADVLVLVLLEGEVGVNDDPVEVHLLVVLDVHLAELFISVLRR